VANPVVVVDFLANTRELQKGISQAQKSTSGFGSKLRSLAKGGAIAAGAAGVGALVATLKIGIDEYGEAAKIGAQTNAVLKSTGEAANVSADHVSDLAGAIMKKSGIDDEAIQSGENLLLTFTNIRNEAGKGNDIFDQTTSIMADMATAMGQDPKTAAMQLGKALNDPIKGVSKLSKVGVTFTEQQKKSIAALQEHGKTAEAQKVILQELQKEFGGSAEAAGKTLPGQINIAKQTFNNFAGMLVGKMIPVLQDVIAWLRDHWPEISRAIKDMWTQIQPVFVNLGQLVVTVVGVIRDNWGTIGPIVNAVATIVKDAAKIISGALKLIVDLIHGDWSQAWKDVKQIVSAAIDGIKTILTTQPKVMLGLATKIGEALLEGVKAGLAGLAGAVSNLIHNATSWAADFLAGIGTRAAALGRNIVSGLLGGMAGVVEDVKTRLTGAWTWSKDFLDTILTAGATLGTKLLEGIKGALTGAAAALKTIFKTALNAVIGLWNGLRIPGFHIHIKIPGPIPDIDFGWGGMDLPNIPLLAKGAVVDRPTLAMVGEGAGREIVAPEGLLRQIVAEQRPEVRVFIGDQELRGLVRYEVRTEQNRVAQTLLAGAV